MVIFVTITMTVAVGRGIWAVSGSKTKQPDIILLVWDTVGADRMSLSGYGHPTTPYAEELAKTSINFIRAHSIQTLPSPVTSVFLPVCIIADMVWATG